MPWLTRASRQASPLTQEQCQEVTTAKQLQANQAVHSTSSGPGCTGTTASSLEQLPVPEHCSASSWDPPQLHCNCCFQQTNNRNTANQQPRLLLQTIVQSAGTAHPGLLTGAAVTSLVFTLGAPVLLKGLTGWGVANAFVLGTTVYAAFGPGGFSLVMLYFLFGTAVSA